MPTSLEPIQILAGVEPVTDKPSATTQHYIYSKGIRFIDGFPEKIGGWESLDFDSAETIEGVARSIYSYKLSGYNRYLVGTNSNLYDVFGSVLTNITPVKETSVAVPDSLDTYYGTLGNNPIATVDGSTTVTVTDTAHKFRAGDTVTLSGSSSVNGIPDTEINGNQYVRSVTTNSYTFIVTTPATSTGSGGGASVVRTSGHITVNSAAHGLSNDDRIKVSGAADTGGILAAQINREFEIRNVTTNTFDVYTAGTATSSVAGGGGASTVYFEPINAGPADTLQGQGYGVGLYGVGLYGVSKTSSTTTPARLWSHARFGDLTVSAFNNQSSVYSWDGNTQTAPAKVTNSPTANYVFVSDEICVVLGYDTGQAAPNGNGISWSDQGGLTNWTTGQAGSDTIEGAGRFISHAAARGENLLFTENQVYTFRYIGGQFIWQTRLLENGVGLIGQNARASASGTIFWMSNNNFYMWRGGSAEIVPSNSSSASTILRYVFDDLNYSQKEKIFAWYNEEFREVWWHYPSDNSNEPDRIARLNIDTFVWCPDEMDRTAAEYPSVLSQTPYLANIDTIYLHEKNGLNDNGGAFSWSLTSPYVYTGTNTTQVSAFVPDNTLTGAMTAVLNVKNYPSSVVTTSKSYTITPTTDRVSAEQNGRYVQIALSASAVDQTFGAGQWYIEVLRSSPK